LSSATKPNDSLFVSTSPRRQRRGFCGNETFLILTFSLKPRLARETPSAATGLTVISDLGIFSSEKTLHDGGEISGLFPWFTFPLVRSFQQNI
jgi:hypothetical protein